MKNIKMDVKMSFIEVMSEVRKDLKDVSVGIFKKSDILYKNFVRNLKSKLARSTFTSPSRIRVKEAEEICFWWSALGPIGTSIW
jgi:hypothetical protein